MSSGDKLCVDIPLGVQTKASSSESFGLDVWITSKNTDACQDIISNHYDPEDGAQIQNNSIAKQRNHLSPTPLDETPPYTPAAHKYVTALQSCIDPRLVNLSPEMGQSQHHEPTRLAYPFKIPSDGEVRGPMMEQELNVQYLPQMQSDTVRNEHGHQIEANMLYNDFQASRMGKESCLSSNYGVDAEQTDVLYNAEGRPLNPSPMACYLDWDDLKCDQLLKFWFDHNSGLVPNSESLSALAHLACKKPYNMFQLIRKQTASGSPSMDLMEPLTRVIHPIQGLTLPAFNDLQRKVLEHRCIEEDDWNSKFEQRNEQTPYICPRCGSTFVNGDKLYRHMVEQAFPQVFWVCLICDLPSMFTRKERAKAHLEKHHFLGQDSSEDLQEYSRKWKFDVAAGFNEKCPFPRCVESPHTYDDIKLFYEHVSKGDHIGEVRKKKRKVNGGEGSKKDSSDHSEDDDEDGNLRGRNGRRVGQVRRGLGEKGVRNGDIGSDGPRHDVLSGGSLQDVDIKIGTASDSHEEHESRGNLKQDTVPYKELSTGQRSTLQRVLLDQRLAPTKLEVVFPLRIAELPYALRATKTGRSHHLVTNKTTKEYVLRDTEKRQRLMFQEIWYQTREYEQKALIMSSSSVQSMDDIVKELRLPEAEDSPTSNAESPPRATMVGQPATPFIAIVNLKIQQRSTNLNPISPSQATSNPNVTSILRLQLQLSTQTPLERWTKQTPHMEPFNVKAHLIGLRRNVS